ncbi:MAG: nitrous oxide reductase family maturation protein NosD [Ignavibacteriaceae bacterium]|nr:nitrous oxide reductase family maturation protein NosD [Ignavibacteria bacterium]MBT8391826.1 nitrous oxide reductase family maturation protein NosD [Ignavibacteria bacterium]NNJ51887.1 nitrous oxide reductase family maturation protein NosD [Ignavibacteriaceae bacterium]NNL21095.1 nitrous oxide reductase family maturation protein NosD [Ignavibacteriaceae bacterium]
MKFSFSILLLIILCSSINFSETIIVSKSGKVKSISAALNLANDGDEILIEEGTYEEGNIIVKKSVKIRGKGFPVIDGKGDGEVFTVLADDVLIEGFIIKNSGISYLEENAGVRLEEVRNCTVTNNRFINNFFAVYLAKTANCLISNNHIEGIKKRETNSGNGIHLWYCKNITVEKNTILNHRDGIYFEFVRHGKIENNFSKGNLRYGLHFMFSDSCEYRKNTFELNGAGVAVMYTKNVLMEENIFKLNWGPASYGILLKEISDSEISNNLFEENSIGIYMEGCSRITIEQNDFVKNGWALKLMANSMGNYFYENNFVANSFDLSTNSRQNFNTFERNYWANYSGYDLDKDGYGDVPFRPVTMFSMMVEDQPTSLILLNSLFIKILDVAESIVPAITPKALTDPKPKMSSYN